MENGLSVTFTIRLSPEDLAKLPQGTLHELCNVARAVIVAQAKPMLAEHEAMIAMLKREIESLEDLKKHVDDAAQKTASMPSAEECECAGKQGLALLAGADSANPPPSE